MPKKKADGIKHELVKAHCPYCDGERVCYRYGHVYVPWDWSDNEGHYMNGGVDHSLLQCRGCEVVFYLHDSWNDEDYHHGYDAEGNENWEPSRTKVTYPKPESKTRPVWLDAISKRDAQLQDILDEMYTAYDNDALILTAVGLRTSLDRATEVLGIDPAITFEEKLTQLNEGGWIGATEREILGVVTDAGNAAAHRGWSPLKKDVGKLLSAMDAFLYRAFIVGQDALAIKASIPPKPKRKKPAKAKKI